ncbi:efflux RND transporter periplasmic adaptor subunit [Zobellella denitrificans]|uniref:efflux RND transporter periplasmic adaptor subunit n=1 Tax=Zobellella denitrificans TaxID=347534 RepID=UPI0015953FEF|nr:HlyD family secretion protein [Zobellella denitrificans]
MMLPSLRPDLQLSTASPEHDGSPRWTLADPVRGRYFHLGAGAMRLLRHWSLGRAELVLAAANREPGLPLQGGDLEQLLYFLRSHDLVAATDPEQRGSYTAKAAAQRRSLWSRVLHQYLFFRIPLWRPDPFLNRTWPWLARHGGWLLRLGLPLVLLLGIFLVSRDWSRFVSTFPHLFSLGGMAAFAVALVFAKFCHELGHAYMAKRAGCRVQSMGLAFMVLFPLFYTDVSDAWRVNHKGSRLLIGAGGMLAELLLAALALLAWSLLPDGPLRTAAFLLASATWITTLVVNLNPFLRFDGYFLLSDLWGVDNLQQRAFALCRWRLREALFGYGEAAPEPLPPRLQKRMLGWGYAAWLWRALLFLGIALAVYHLFFKLLGIILMVVELAWFIALPVLRELGEWWRRRRQARPVRGLLVAGLLLAGLALLLYPWRSQVSMPAMLEAAASSALHAPFPARVKAVLAHNGQQVKAGDLLLELSSPDLDYQLQLARREVDLLQRQLQRRSALADTAADSSVLEQQLAQALAEYRGLQAQRQRLQLRAPLDGTLHDMPPDLEPGRWLASGLRLGTLVAPGARLRGYLAETRLWRLEAGMQGRFIADDPSRPALAVTLEQIDTVGANFLQQEALASDRGGPIAVHRNRQGRAEPQGAHYAVRLRPDDTLPPLRQPQRGVVVIDGRSESWASSVWRRVAAIGVRESGF